MIVENRQAGVFPQLKKPSLKNCDDVFDETEKIVERCNDRFSFKDFDIGEGYVSGKFCIALAISDFWNTKQEYAFIEPAFGAGVQPNGLIVRKIGSADEPRSDSCDNGCVLIDQVKLVDGIEHIVPSRIRLLVMDHYLSFRAKSLYMFLRAGLRAFVTLFVEGEMNVAKVGCPVQDGEAASEMIKGGSQVMSSVSNDSSELIRWLVGCLDKKILLGPRLINLPLLPKGICRQEGGNERFRITDVGFGPLNL